MEEIRVLIYTDRHNPADMSKNMTLEPADPMEAPFGLSLMRDLILIHADKGVKPKIDLVNRNICYHAAQKITPELLKQYHELWVFGQFKAKGPAEYNVENGGPYNELDDNEVCALRDWMDEGGGVLITGDHSEVISVDGESKIYNLGRALGHRIPRAGEMRIWEGGPVISGGRDGVNTQSPGRLDSLHNNSLEYDVEPQHIILELDITQKSDIRPHELFSGGPANRILVFPDHAHEGALRPPQLPLDCKVWPKGSVPHFVVAKGHDKRFFPFPVCDLVSVYEGHLVKVGRIVADSSWHHYLNLNLRSLRHDLSDPTAARNQIGKYYANLVRWLAPPCIQAKLTPARLYWIATHPQVLEVAGSDVRSLGNTAQQVLLTECQPDEIENILQLSLPHGFIEQAESFDFVPEELRLGTLIKHCHEVIRRSGMEGEQKLMDKKESEALVNNAFKQALEIHLADITGHASHIRNALEILPANNPLTESPEPEKRNQYQEPEETDQ